MSKKEDKILTFEDIDILESIGSDLCESIRDLIYNIKEIKNEASNYSN